MHNKCTLKDGIGKMIAMDIEVRYAVLLKSHSVGRKIKLDDYYNHSELFENLKVYLLARWEVLV